MSLKQSSRKLRYVLGAFALLLLSGKALYGQSSTAFTATLSGSVIDPAGAAVSGAKVVLTSPDIGFSRTYSTKDTGLYTFTFLPPAVYVLEVEAPGFKHYRQAAITLVAGQAAEQNVSLVVGAVTDKIEITSQVPLVNADNANISEDLSARFAEDLPLNFRSVISLTLINSSVNNAAEEQVVGAPGLAQTADQDISFLNFGGTFFDTAEYLVDGTWDTRADWGGVIYVPSVDAVQELKVQTNAFTAQYGWSSGNVVNIVTKSGSNDFHGDAYEFYANSSLDAKYFFNNGAQPAFHRNQYGGTIGGPILKNKLFFFAYYEGLRQASPETQVYTLPTGAERTGNFSALLGPQIVDSSGKPILDYEGRAIFSGAIYNPFSSRQVTCGGTDPVTGNVVSNCPKGVTTEFIRDPISGNLQTGMGVTNIIPAALIDKIASGIAVANFWPTAGSGLSSNFTATAAAPEHSDEYSGRVDYNFDDNNRIYGRWSQKYQTKTNTPAFFGASDPGGPGLLNPNNRYSTNLGVNHIFNPTFTMNFNFGVNRHVEGGIGQGFGFKASALGLPSFIDGIAPAFPQISFSGGGGYAGLGANDGNNNYIAPQTLWTTSVDFTKIRGRHALAFGFTDVWLRIDGGHYGQTALNFQTASTSGPDPNNPTGGTGNGFASFLVGVGSGSNGTSCALCTSFQAFPATDKHFLGWYVQDGWKVTPKITFTLGLRYEIQTAPTERRNAQNYFDFTAKNPISAQVGASAFFPGELIFNSPGNSGLYKTPYNNVAPRVSVAIQASNKAVVRAGYGIFYVPNFYGQGPNDGFSQPTPWVTSLNNGLNPASTLSGNANVTCENGGVFAPCGSAFPNGERLPTGNAAGGLQDVGFGATITNNNRQTPYVEQWMAGVQYSFTPNDLLDVSYVGNHGTNLLATGEQWQQMSPGNLAMGNALFAQVPNPFFGHITSSGCGLNNPTVILAQTLAPFPEYCSVFEPEPAVGTSSYNALEATFTHRWHSGLDLNLSYTFSKFMDDVQGNSGWAFPGSGTSNLNSYNLSADYSVDPSNVTHRFVATYDYELPFGKGKRFGGGWSRAVDAVAGGWQWTGILTAESGLPLSIQPAANNVGFGFNQRPNVVAGVNPIPANQSITNWLNPAAFSQPAAFTFGDAPRFFSNLHGPKYFNWDMGIQKRWSFMEHKQFQFRFEMFNALNHPDFFQPDTNLSDVSSGNFGRITAAYQQRTVQLAGKFYF